MEFIKYRVVCKQMILEVRGYMALLSSQSKSPVSIS